MDKIGFVPSLYVSGNSNTKLGCKANDKNPANDQNFYRLKQLDLDNRFEYSGIRLVTVGGEGQLNLWPNPINNDVVIEGLTGNGNINLMDNNGRELVSEQVKGNKHTLRLNTLAEGVYFAQVLKDGKTVSSHKV